MKWIGRSLALVCAADVVVVGWQFVRNARWARHERWHRYWQSRPLDYNDCMNMMLDLYHNDFLSPIAEKG
jgi:hypothetical protein